MNKKYLWNCFGLLDELGVVSASDDRCFNITGLNISSQFIQKGDLFLAIQGSSRHGIAFAKEAIDRGAIAVACDAKDLGIKKIDAVMHSLKNRVPVYWVKDLKSKLGVLASVFFGHPSKRVSVIGVTGTNGKSTCMHFIASIFHSLGIKCGVSGTLGRGVYPNVETTGMTTPDVINVHRHLAQLDDMDVSKAVMEVSSHALEQGRVQGVEFSTAIFTNLSHDHLDYHKTMARYFQAKKTLFTDYSPQVSIINRDDPYAKQLMAIASGRVVGYSMKKDEADGETISGYLSRRSLNGGRCVLSYRGESITVETPFFAEFFISNLLASLAAVISQGVDFQVAAHCISDLSAPKGRLECVSNKECQPKVWIDYAHTPSALENVLLELRKVCTGKLWCVFGCGGDRDKEKRPLMGAFAEKNSDVIVVTNDNPRSESPEMIASDITQGFKNVQQHKIIFDRQEAIHYAVMNAKKEDLILIAGKGHELSQEVGDEKVVPLDEREIIVEAFFRRGND